MQAVNLITLSLLIIGGINWAIFALAGSDLVGSIFGGPDTGFSKFIYLLVGASAIWQLIPLFRPVNRGEVAAQQDRR
jgi:uncharacterized protein